MNYNEQVKNILNNAGIDYRAHLVARDTIRDNWKCDSWRVLLIGARRVGEEFSYHTGIGLRKGGKCTVDIADFISCMILDSEACGMCFEDWCDCYGYDTDCRKAYRTYEACVANGLRLRGVIDGKTMGNLKKVLEDY